MGSSLAGGRGNKPELNQIKYQTITGRKLRHLDTWEILKCSHIFLHSYRLNVKMFNILDEVKILENCPNYPDIFQISEFQRLMDFEVDVTVKS